LTERRSSGARGDGEAGVLERIRYAFEPRAAARGRSKFVALAMGDDAALVRPSAGFETVLTCDWFLEGTHFLRDKHPADSVGWKCLARAVSDVVAMGGLPRCFLLSLALPKDLPARWLDGFLGGLKRASKAFACELAGGDSTERRDILINVAVVGEVRRGRALLRSGARPGDIIYVSGRLGEAELGLKLVREGRGRPRTKDERVRKHLYPEPNLALGQWLCQKRLATAIMDLSDGLSTDLRRLCEASGVRGAVFAPMVPAVRLTESERSSGMDALELALHGGDDYELLFAVPDRKKHLIPRVIASVPVTAVGRTTAGRGVVLIDKDGKSSELMPLGWDPFRNKR
jgi:thiamine-monophosphate kinase